MPNIFTRYWTVRNEAYEYFHNNIRPIPHTYDALGNFEPIDKTSVHNNDVDAFRHAYSSAIFAAEYGAETAHMLGDANEVGGDLRQQGSQSRNMDKWNNSAGRDIGELYPSSDPNYKQHIADAVKEVLENGDLIESPSDPRQYTGSDFSEDVRDLIDQALANAGAVFQEILDYLQSLFDDILDGDSPFAGAYVTAKIGDAASLFGIAATDTSPLVIDLGGDGFHFDDLNASAAFFDLDNDQFAEHTAWIHSDPANKLQDGFLARDLNANGQIDNNGELFGDTGGTSAWAKLAALDSNADGKVDALDPAFASLRVWNDANANGVSESGELLTMAQAGIQSVGLQLNNTTTVIDGQTTVGNAIITKTDNSTRAMTDVFFHNDNLNSWFVGDGTSASTAAYIASREMMHAVH